MHTAYCAAGHPPRIAKRIAWMARATMHANVCYHAHAYIQYVTTNLTCRSRRVDGYTKRRPFGTHEYSYSIITSKQHA